MLQFLNWRVEDKDYFSSQILVVLKAETEYYWEKN